MVDEGRGIVRKKVVNNMQKNKRQSSRASLQVSRSHSAKSERERTYEIDDETLTEMTIGQFFPLPKPIAVQGEEVLL